MAMPRWRLSASIPERKTPGSASDGAVCLNAARLSCGGCCLTELVPPAKRNCGVLCTNAIGHADCPPSRLPLFLPANLYASHSRSIAMALLSIPQDSLGLDMNHRISG